MKALVYIPAPDATHITGAICDSAITRARDPFFIPDEGLRQRVTLRGVRIDRLGKGIREKFAPAYYSECLTAVHTFSPDEAGTALRWARDGAIIVSPCTSAENISDESRTLLNKLIARFSDSMTLKTGDLILFAQPSEQWPEIASTGSHNIEIESAHGFPPMTLKIR